MFIWLSKNKSKMPNTNTTISLSYFTSSLRCPTPLLLHKGVTPKTTFYDFGSQGIYFCVLSSKKVSEFSIINNLRLIDNTSYLLLEFESKEDFPSFFYLGINTLWLNIEVKIDSITLQAIASKIIDSWLKINKSILLKHQLFVKCLLRCNYKSILISNYFFELFFQFLTDLELHLCDKPSIKFKDFELQKIREIEEKITQNLFLATPTIETMAKMANMSSSKFKTLFREVFGQSVRQHILDKKMAHAHGLLQSGKYTFTQIAYKLGYSHASGFTRMLKKDDYSWVQE
jgi:AraC family transcriptional regulator, exoenzyme S synthesis regulatory protein ExsA